MTLRWNEYVLSVDSDADRPEVQWSSGSESVYPRRPMFVLGVGFDPRALLGLQRFLRINHRAKPVVGLVELFPPSAASGTRARAAALLNREQFEYITKSVEVRTILHERVHARMSEGPRIARVLTSKEFLYDVGQAILDVSSLPTSIFFPIASALLGAIDKQMYESFQELHLVTSENPAADDAVDELGVSDASFIGGFRSGFTYDSAAPIVWSPTIGHGCGPALRAIYDSIKPADVCPVLPFPAKNPRRSDDLLLEHQGLLMDSFRVGSSNVIFANERNPFDLYRTLVRLQDRLLSALLPLGQTSLVLSTHSSKTLSIGAFLAAYERKMPVITAPVIDYELSEFNEADVANQSHLMSAWIAGSPYCMPAENVSAADELRQV